VASGVRHYNNKDSPQRTQRKTETTRGLGKSGKQQIYNSTDSPLRTLRTQRKTETTRGLGKSGKQQISQQRTQRKTETTSRRSP
jgi:hypothetical protein